MKKTKKEIIESIKAKMKVAEEMIKWSEKYKPESKIKWITTYNTLYELLIEIE